MYVQSQMYVKKELYQFCSSNGTVLCSFREIILMKFLRETNTHTETKNSLMSIKHN